MRLERQFAVPSEPDAVWNLFWNIPELASCIPGCVGVESADGPQRYRAVVKVSVGRFRVQFELAIEVMDSVRGESIKARAQGRDRITRSTIVADLDFHVTGDANGGALVSLANEFQVYGRLGSLGHNIIKRRSDDLMDEFAADLRDRLANDGQTSVGASAEQTARDDAPRPERQASGRS